MSTQLCFQVTGANYTDFGVLKVLDVEKFKDPDYINYNEIEYFSQKMLNLLSLEKSDNCIFPKDYTPAYRKEARGCYKDYRFKREVLFNFESKNIDSLAIIQNRFSALEADCKFVANQAKNETALILGLIFGPIFGIPLLIWFLCYICNLCRTKPQMLQNREASPVKPHYNNEMHPIGLQNDALHSIVIFGALSHDAGC